jgi:hypothetical protein
MRYFKMTMQSNEIPKGATIAVDEAVRKLIRGETFAFKNPSGAFFVAKIDTLTEKKGKRGPIAACEVVGRVADWWIEPARGPGVTLH